MQEAAGWLPLTGQNRNVLRDGRVRLDKTDERERQSEYKSGERLHVFLSP